MTKNTAPRCAASPTSQHASPKFCIVGDDMSQTAQTERPLCRLVRAGETFVGKQALFYNVGVSAESVGAHGIHMQIVTIPPGARAKAHKHQSHETAIYALRGTSHVWHGERLEHHSIVKPGDFFYIPANVPHLPYNPSESEDAVALIARTDPKEQESVVLLPELDAPRGPQESCSDGR